VLAAEGVWRYMGMARRCLLPGFSGTVWAGCNGIADFAVTTTETCEYLWVKWTAWTVESGQVCPKMCE